MRLLKISPNMMKVICLYNLFLYSGIFFMDWLYQINFPVIWIYSTAHNFFARYMIYYGNQLLLSSLHIALLNLYAPSIILPAILYLFLDNGSYLKRY